MEFQYPFFYSYPPYFTWASPGRAASSGPATPMGGPGPDPLAPHRSIQPVQETREKQLSLWCSLILAYCKHHKVSGPAPWRRMRPRRCAPPRPHTRSLPPARRRST
jgi:hypothetical protein